MILENLSPEEITQAIENNAIGTVEVWDKWPGLELQQNTSVTWSITDVPFPVFNSVIRTNATPETIDGIIDEVIARGRGRNVPLAWWITSSVRPTDLTDHLVAKGFILAAHLPGMAVNLAQIKEDLPRPTGLVVEEITDEESLRVWSQVVGESNEFPDFAADAWLQIYSTMGLGSHLPWKHYLARLDGSPVAASSLLYHAGVAGVHTVGTLPEFRRQGIGTAVTVEPLLAARRDGYRVGVLFSSDMGLNIYRSLGFQEYCQGSLYIWSEETG